MVRIFLGGHCEPREMSDRFEGSGIIREAVRKTRRTTIWMRDADAKRSTARMRFVPIKTEEQVDLQALHRVAERWVMRRTAVVNQIRSLLLERGLTLPKGRRYLDEQLPLVSWKTPS